MTEPSAPFPVTERAPRAAAGRQPPPDEAFCPACGAPNRAAAKFCIACIGPLKGTLAGARPPMVPYAPQYGPTSSFTHVETPLESEGRRTDAMSRRVLPDGTVIEGFKTLRLLGEGCRQSTLRRGGGETV